MSGHIAEPGRGWWARLFGDADRAEDAERLARIEQRLTTLGRQLEELRATPTPPPDLTAIEAALAGIEKQVGRAGREQFKANSIAEAQAGQLNAALEQLRVADRRREAELQAAREQGRRAVAEARLALVQSLLPALDGIDQALHAGQQLLAAAPSAPAASAPQAGWLQRLLAAPPPPAAPSQGDELRPAVESWLVGLEFVRRRLLDTLAAEDVRPIHAAGQPFDPLRHLAAEVVPASAEHAAGQVVEELRRGYLTGERVLRHAEVVVAAERLEGDAA